MSEFLTTMSLSDAKLNQESLETSNNQILTANMLKKRKASEIESDKKNSEIGVEDVVDVAPKIGVEDVVGAQVATSDDDDLQITSSGESDNLQEKTIEEQEAEMLNSLPRIVHTENDGKNECQFCGNAYKNFKFLNDHKRLVHPTSYFACPVIECRLSGGQKMFDCVREVVTHYIREHTEKDEKGSIICKINGCTSHLSEQKSFNKHIKNYHPDDEDFFKMAAKFYVACGSNHVHQRAARVAQTRKKN